MVIETFLEGTGSRWGSTLGRNGGKPGRWVSIGVGRQAAAAMEPGRQRTSLIAEFALPQLELKFPMKGPRWREYKGVFRAPRLAESTRFNPAALPVSDRALAKGYYQRCKEFLPHSFCLFQNLLFQRLQSPAEPGPPGKGTTQAARRLVPGTGPSRVIRMNLVGTSMVWQRRWLSPDRAFLCEPWSVWPSAVRPLHANRGPPPTNPAGCPVRRLLRRWRFSRCRPCWLSGTAVEDPLRPPTTRCFPAGPLDLELRDRRLAPGGTRPPRDRPHLVVQLDQQEPPSAA